jgi:DNA-binding SARP family transcriptional activator
VGDRVNVPAALGLVERAAVAPRAASTGADGIRRRWHRQGGRALRQELQAEAFLTTNPVVRLNPPVVTSDLQEFEAALRWQELAEAVALYQGPFLDGFYLSGLAEFERWVETERSRLEATYQAALETLAAGASAAGDTHGAVM